MDPTGSSGPAVPEYGGSAQEDPIAGAVAVIAKDRRSGTLVLWSAHLAGRDPDVWNDPLRFDPDRFLALSDDQRTAADAAWVPFGGGRRNCIGFALAQMELTMLIARLAQRLDVSLPAAGKPGPVGMVVNRPRGGVPARIRRRS